MERYHSHYINGQWQAGKGEIFHSHNPATQVLLWSGQSATTADASLAFAAAKQALPGWSNMGFAARVAIVERFGEIVKTHHQRLQQCIAEEAGKPLWEAATEVSSVLNKIKYSIAAYQARTADQEMPNPEAKAFIRYKPQGVVAVLGPFNFPAHLSNGHIIPALLAGNTVLYKPSELTPAVAELITQCWEKAGLPAGVLNLVQGDVHTAKALLQQPIQGVYFTGSYAAGVAIHEAFSRRPEVILALEMGGNNPLIIDAVNDKRAAVYHTIVSAFITAGQRCTCARRVFIPDSSAGDQLLEQLIRATTQLQVGPFTQTPEPFMGPVISAVHAHKHLQKQQALLDQGGQAILPMQLLQEKTAFLSPGIIDMTKATQPPDEEIFAPLIQLYRYQSLEAAFTQANQTQFGLAAGLLSDNRDTFEAFYQTMQAGIINWNRPTTGAASNLPFGGIGHSGNHRPAGYFAADYCAYPVGCLEKDTLAFPDTILPGVVIN